MRLVDAIKQVRVLVLLPVIIAVSFAAGQWDERLGSAIAFWVIFVLAAVRLVLLANDAAQWMIARDLARSAAAGRPKDLSMVTLAVLLLAVATPVATVVVTLCAWKNWDSWLNSVARLLASMWATPD